MHTQNLDIMRKPTILLLGMSALLAAGLVMSVFATQELLGSFTIGTNTVAVDSPLEITSEIARGTGMYAVDIMDYTEGMSISATVLGPLQAITTSAIIQADTYEERFPVDETFQYTLVIETDSTPVTVTALIGPEPGATETSLGVISGIMLLVGVVGMIVAAIYSIIHKLRNRGSGNYSTWPGRDDNASRV